jgi:Esterase FrsA-like
MKENEAILQRQSYNTKFKNEDMDFMLNWAIGISQIIGMSPSQIFYAVHNIKDGDPIGWRKGFQEQGNFQIQSAEKSIEAQQRLAAGQSHLGAAYAYRAALQYTNPTSIEFDEYIPKMERAFQQGIQLLGIPVRPIEIPFEGTTLSGYFLEQDKEPRPAVVMVGGGDTFREDLFYFAGYPGWKRGYNVIMVDLPG